MRSYAQKSKQLFQGWGSDLARLHPGRVQAKLKVNAAGDVHEQEADRIAAEVMKMPEPKPAGNRAGDGESPRGRREGAAGPHHPATKITQTNAGGGTEAPVVAGEMPGSGGRQMDASTRAFMEPRFAHDFSGVRIHAGPEAADAARALRARAFTLGSDLVFGEGEFAPGTSKGRRLLAHELTHFLQQRSGQTGPGSLVQRDEKRLQQVRGVKSPNVQLREGALKSVQTQLEKRMQKRKAEIQALLDELGPAPKSDKAKARAEALKKDLAKDLATIIDQPDSAPVNKALRNDIKASSKSVDVQKLKLKTAQDQWSKYDAIFAGDKVAAALGTQTLSAAELKALVAQESGDLTEDDQKGDIAGIAQLGKTEEKLGGGKPGDRKIPEKALIIVANIISLYAGQLDKGLSAKPSGVERKKFIMAAYNSGPNAIITAQREAIQMKRSGTTWQSLIEGGKNSPLYKAIVATYKKGTDYDAAFKEKSEYPGKIFDRLP
jgi:hypothetical protein